MRNAITLGELEAIAPEQRTLRLLPVDSLVAGLDVVVLPADLTGRILQGQAAQIDGTGKRAGMVRLYDQNRRFMGLGELQDGGRLAPKRLVAVLRSAPGEQIPKIA
jgi:tRNA pseudouridine55 synthase